MTPVDYIEIVSMLGAVIADLTADNPGLADPLGVVIEAPRLQGS